MPDHQFDPKNLPGLKQSDIKPCAACKKPIGHAGHPIFYTFEISYCMVDAAAVQRAHGLEMHMGAAAPLAQIMGPNEDLAKKMQTADGWICFDCAMALPVAEVSERAGQEDEADG